MKIALIGYYGENFGDILMLCHLIDEIKKNGHDVIIFSYAKPSKQLSLAFNEDIKFICDNSFISLMKDITKCQWLVWGGGTCFMDEGGTGGIKFMLPAFLCGVNIGYVGIGVGKCNLFKTKLLLRVANFISKKIHVRDDHSMAYFSKDKAINGRDLVFCLHSNEPILYQKNKKQSKKLMIAYRNMDGFHSNPLIIRKNFIKSMLAFINKHKFNEVELVDVDSIDSVDNDDISVELQHYFDSEVVKIHHRKHVNPQDIISAIRSSDYIISGRLHVGVFSAILCKPFSLVNYSPKNKRMLSQIDMVESNVDVANFNLDNTFDDYSLKIPDYNKITEISKMAKNKLALFLLLLK